MTFVEHSLITRERALFESLRQYQAQLLEDLYRGSQTHRGGSPWDAKLKQVLDFVNEHMSDSVDRIAELTKLLPPSIILTSEEAKRYELDRAKSEGIA